MDTSLFNLINTVKVFDLIVTTALFALIGGTLIKQRKNIKDFLEGWRKKRNFEDSIADSIQSLHERNEELNTKIDSLEKIVDDHREVSKNVRKEIYADISNVSNDIKTLIDRVETMNEKEALSKRANIKSKIEKLYRECSESKLCTDMQLETLKDLIEDYERYGGHNSFVHSLVEKEMYTWDVIEKIPNTTH